MRWDLIGFGMILTSGLLMMGISVAMFGEWVIFPIVGTGLLCWSYYWVTM